MGTINYGTSDYITVGYNCNNVDYEEEFYNDYIQYDYEDINYFLQKYDFYYFRVTIEPGYYEGFYINIENNFGVCYNDYQQKKEALKEVTQIKKFLLGCLNYNCCVVRPGWCTAYLNERESINAINVAANYMRMEVKEAPTYYKMKIKGEAI